MTQPQKTAYHHGDLKEALVKATREIIEAEGVDQFTMRESARRAGVSHGAPAHHFGDKTGLLTQVAIEALSERLALADAYAAAAGEDPLDQLKACGLAHVEFMIAHPKLSDMCWRAELTDRSNPELQAVMQRMSSTLIDRMSAVTGELLNPEKEKNPTTLLALTVVHGFATLVNERVILADVPEEERLTRALEMARTMFSLLEGAFRPRDPDAPGDLTSPEPAL